ncbi:hypothetical protein ACQPUL_21200 [Clostridium butyricum]|uniref:DUF669 domain-containing protein n=1 Tax=Clostridium butyricum TaxID=1492 RepID=A0A6N3GRE7_CLOBU|nr:MULTISPECIES: hypothetical protein [Clostridium]POO86607.1 hypothetical protein C1H59_09870 [Clostridium sp. 3-3]QUF82849.1 hypothetical protein KDJ93_14090 [Clostridium butyricum]UZT05810.1 hypothetical protein ONV75_14590 [Clostridium sp. LQ25]
MAVRKIVSGSVKSRDGIPSNNNGLVISLKKPCSIFEDGEILKAKVISIEGTSPVNTATGLTQRVKVEFEVYMNDGNIRKLVQNFLLIEHDNQPFYQLLMTTVGRTDGVTPNDLIGQEVGIQIGNSKAESGTFSNVVAIVSLDELEEENNKTFNLEKQNIEDNVQEYEY